MWPDAPVVAAFLARVRRRHAWQSVARAAAIGLVAASAVLVAGWFSGWAAGVIRFTAATVSVLPVAFALRRERRRRAATALRVEARAPACRNVVVTAAELLDEPARVRPAIGERVFRDAARSIRGLDVRAVAPLARSVLMAAAASIVFTIVLATTTAAPRARLAPQETADHTSPTIGVVTIVVRPPAYAGGAIQTLRDPERLIALVGSRLELTVAASSAGVTVETQSAAPLALDRSAAGTFIGDATIDGDGFATPQMTGADGPVGPRRVIGVSATRDLSPAVRVTAPAKDLYVPDARRSVPVAIAADDDLGLASLELVFTKVSGSGENFQFREGRVPVAISRADAKHWTATADWSLAGLGLGPGDLLVYRAQATDRRPAPPVAESDAFIIEVVAPGSVASAGFAIDDQRDRYALSQQMVILKTERLIARRPTLAADALADEALSLAAEQRQVRAEFVFMMGGEIADEEVEAAGEPDVQSGRLANSGRTDLLLAIRDMSQAATDLSTPDLASALSAERSALAALQRAFTRARYILRTLTRRERLDESRRLTGTLSGVARTPRPAGVPESNPRAAGIRRALAGVTALAALESFSADDRAATATIAETVLRVDAGSAALREVADDLARAGRHMAVGDEASARSSIDAAVEHLAAALRASVLAGPGATPAADDRRLAGAIADALRGGGGR